MSSSISLTQAVTSGDESAVSALLADGADVNETTNGGQSALILAVIRGHTHLVRLLVKAGADPHLRDNLGLTAIEWAQRRGLNEALSILTNTSATPTAPKRIIVPIEEPAEVVPPGPPAETEKREQVPDDEKSRQWLSGLKQRLDEMEVRRLNQNEPEPKPLTPEEPPPLMTAATKEPPVETMPVPAPARTEIPSRNDRPTGRIFVVPESAPAPPVKRKRCPQCNEIYNGDLLSYCSHHIVPLVDADEPIIAPPPPPKENPALFWIMVAVTLCASIVIGSLITAYLFKSNQAAARSAAAQQPQPIIQKGVPEVGGDLAGKAVSLPEAECPLRGPEPLSGTVIVRVKVNRKGEVLWAQGSGGDWLMRGAATEAAMKSTFSPEKLRTRETEGTITYTFKP